MAGSAEPVGQTGPGDTAARGLPLSRRDRRLQHARLSARSARRALRRECGRQQRPKRPVSRPTPNASGAPIATIRRRVRRADRRVRKAGIWATRVRDGLASLAVAPARRTKGAGGRFLLRNVDSVIPGQGKGRPTHQGCFANAMSNDSGFKTAGSFSIAARLHRHDGPAQTMSIM